jgi:NAD(P) transhydrogenase
MDLDLLVVGSGPSGQKAAIQAAKLGKRVAVIERRQRLGGVSIHTGTIPSKTLRVAVLDELARRPLDVPDPLNPESRERQAIEFLMDRTARVVGAEAQVVREQFRRNRVGLLFGEGSFIDEHTICITDEDGKKEITAANIVIACGTNPARPKGVHFDDETIIDSDGLLHLHQRLPRSMVVVGAGVIGVEYASMFGRLGTKVTVVDARPRVLTFLDGEIGEALQYILRRNNVTFRLNEAVAGVTSNNEGEAVTKLASGKTIRTETVLYATGRQGATESLDLGKAGLEADKRGRISVDECYRTNVDHIYAVGDVAGGAGLAATAMEQGRIAEIAMVGRTEEDLTEAGVPYVSGIARYSELARGLMMGDEDGILKLLVSSEDRSLLGVHVLGTGAADLVHIGQAVMGGGGGVDFLVGAVFNYPTFAEAYKVAALDAVNRMG